VQTFKKEGTNRVILNMQYPSQHGGHESVLEVVMTRRKTN
jgi:hypothetical protein